MLRLSLLLVIGFPILLNGQSNTQTQDPRRGAGNTYFVDEIGLRLATERPLEGFINPDTYILGASDILSVDVRGAIPTTWRGMAVNISGDLVIPGVGTVLVGDVSLTDAKVAISKLVEQQFRNSEIIVTLERPKPVNVHVTGDVPSPGRYLFPAQTRVDAIVIPIITGNPITVNIDGPGAQPRAMGGLLKLNQNPITHGRKDIRVDEQTEALERYDLRNVIIHHRDGRVSTADLVAYFYGGVSEANPFVQDGEFIQVRKKSLATSRIGVSGGVRQAFETQYNPNDTPEFLIRIAGGYTEEADSLNIHIVRRTESGLVSIHSIPMNEPLQPNDRLVIPVDKSKITNQSVWISGEINHPGNYPIIEGVTSLSDLLRFSGGMTTKALLSSVYIERGNKLYSEEESYGRRVQRMQRTSNQFNEGLEYIQRDFGLSHAVVFINLNVESALKSTLLYDGDRIHIPKDENTVMLFGQVNRTGYYVYEKGKTVNDYLNEAGGFSLSADKERVFVIKSYNHAWYLPSETTLESGDMIFVDRQPYEDFISYRQNQFQERQLAISRNQFYLSIVTTIASLITTAIILNTR